jgi:hypothetical protein
VSPRCDAFVLCENEATHEQPHPILGHVPCCDRCARLITDEDMEPAITLSELGDAIRKPVKP